MKILLTGGAGFIGSAVVRHLLTHTDHHVVTVDKLTYAGSLSTLDEVLPSDRHAFEQVDICDRKALERVFREHEPDGVMHLAAESHVDRSIDGPSTFIETNVTGTFTLLDVALRHWQELDEGRQKAFRFHHVSTDEVYGALGAEGMFTEETPYAPNSPYAASKAASDHLVRAWWKTYGLPVVISNCSNNYGPYQFPEKLIPLAILKAVRGEAIPVYGKGDNIRDWLHVEDHARALVLIFTQGVVGEKYNVGGECELTNLDMVERLCRLVDERCPALDQGPRTGLITFVSDRPGHDFRYAIETDHIRATLGWQPERTIDEGLAQTVDWYLNNGDWIEKIRAERYDGQRLGLGAGGASTGHEAAHSSPRSLRGESPKAVA